VRSRLARRLARQRPSLSTALPSHHPSSSSNQVQVTECALTSRAFRGLLVSVPGWQCAPPAPRLLPLWPAGVCTTLGRSGDAMQRGFLTGASHAPQRSQPPGPTAQVHQPGPAEGQAQDRKQESQPRPAPADAHAALGECLDLLRGPTDERRCTSCLPAVPQASTCCTFASVQQQCTVIASITQQATLTCRFVGLLLVTRLLPAGDASTIRAVHDAVGGRFISRLLLPVKAAEVRTRSRVWPACKHRALTARAASSVVSGVPRAEAAILRAGRLSRASRRGRCSQGRGGSRACARHPGGLLPRAGAGALTGGGGVGPTPGQGARPAERALPASGAPRMIRALT